MDADFISIGKFKFQTFVYSPWRKEIFNETKLRLYRVESHGRKFASKLTKEIGTEAAGKIENHCEISNRKET